LRVFLDTNVLISSFITRGLCADIFRIILAEHHLVLSEYFLFEFEVVLYRKVDLPPKQIQSILKYLKTFDVITDQTPPDNLDFLDIRDKNDIPILAAALNGKCDTIVTGDRDLLDVSDKYNIKIVDPKRFLKIVKTK
jgi:putative PIN family toxin of toxin-antitoxin system